MQVLAWVLLLVPVGVFLLLGFRYLVRGTPIRRVRAASRGGEAPEISDEHFTPTMELLTRIDLLPGNDAEIFICGDETYPRLWDDLRKAKRSITVQMYYANPGKVADTIREILIERARAGVKVLFLRDAFGAAKLKDEYFQAMKDAGVEVASFRPIQWYSLEKAYARSHIRVVVVDAEIAYTGGFGLDDKWLGDGRHEGQWRDSNVRFRGPAVMALQATFAAGWADATGQLITGKLFFPEDPEAAGDGPDDAPIHAGVLHAAPTIGSTPAERFLALTIGGACKRLWITNAYFVPDLDFVGLLTHARERGADVRILVPNQKTDSKTVFYASREAYGTLLEGGIRVFEYQPTMHHAKTFVADDLFAGVGTMNFDNRSMAFNDESVFVAYDRDFNGRLAQIFEQDLEYAREVTLEHWRRRPWTEKIVSRVAYSLRRVL
ncbi:MAG TPA: phospholipase D-like domain-containing protein [Gemmatimonadaceae bacterium]|nr:phospholipase D-like domain-containing protein [Gemmatimonadaceae bacterium]